MNVEPSVEGFQERQRLGVPPSERLCSQFEEVTPRRACPHFEERSSERQKRMDRGLIEERLGKVALKRVTPRAKYIAYEHYRTAMEFYDKAEKIQPEDNQDAVLRWNACVRRIEEFKLKASEDDPKMQPFLDV